MLGGSVGMPNLLAHCLARSKSEEKERSSPTKHSRNCKKRVFRRDIVDHFTRRKAFDFLYKNFFENLMGNFDDAFRISHSPIALAGRRPSFSKRTP